MVLKEPRAVARVKPTETDMPVAKGMRSVGAIIQVTFETTPPIAPDATPVLTRSMLVDTVIPHDEPAVAPPRLEPERVTVYGPLGIKPLWTVRTMFVAVGVLAVKVFAGIGLGVADAAMNPEGKLIVIVSAATRAV